VAATVDKQQTIQTTWFQPPFVLNSWEDGRCVCNQNGKQSFVCCIAEWRFMLTKNKKGVDPLLSLSSLHMPTLPSLRAVPKCLKHPAGHRLNFAGTHFLPGGAQNQSFNTLRWEKWPVKASYAVCRQHRRHVVRTSTAQAFAFEFMRTDSSWVGCAKVTYGHAPTTKVNSGRLATRCKQRIFEVTSGPL